MLDATGVDGRQPEVNYCRSWTRVRARSLSTADVLALALAQLRLLSGAFTQQVWLVANAAGGAIVEGPTPSLDDDVAACHRLLSNARDRGARIEPGHIVLATDGAPATAELLRRYRPAALIRVAGVAGELEICWLVAQRDAGGSELAALLPRLFTRLVDEYLAHPGTKLGTFELLSRGEMLRLIGISGDCSDPRPANFVERLYRTARDSGSRLAIEAVQGGLSYQDLWRLSGKLCRELARRGAARQDRMLIVATRSPELVVTLVAALRSGIVFSIVDPRFPDTYIRGCCEIVQPDFVIDLAQRNPPMPVCGKACFGSLPLAELEALPTAEGWDEDLFGPDDLATITFTSGTMRAPKAVAGRYASLFHFFDWMDEHFGPMADWRFGMCSSLAHDPLQRDILTPLYLGAAICIPPADVTTPGFLPRWLAEARIDTVCLTPPLLAFLAGASDSMLPDLKLALFVGGSLARAQVAMLRRIAPEARIVATYGATESQRAVGYFEVPRARAAFDALPANLPIGHGMGDVDLLVCRPGGKALCLPYEIGEIAIRSRFIALGYLGDRELTAAKFRPGLLGPDDDVPAYMTGDYGYCTPDYGVVFVGRTDSQRKIGGHRIDLDQIAAVCREHPMVADAAVILDDSEPHPALIAFLVPVDQVLRFDPAGFAGYLAERLPRYMVPQRVESLPALPLTLNGKIDFGELRRLGAARRHSPALAMPASDVAAEVLAFIRFETGINEPDPSLELAELGIDSLRFLLLQANLEAKFGVAPAAQLDNRLPLATYLDMLQRGAGMPAASPGGGPRASMPPALGPATMVSERRIEFGGRLFDHFCSNSYLGLGSHRELRRRLGEFVASAPSIAAHGAAEVNGLTAWHQAVVEKLMRLYECDEVLLFGSGYLANAAALSRFAGPGDRLYIDESCHRSIFDGCLASRAVLHTFRHNDPRSLEAALGDSPAGDRRRMIVSEGVFGVEGDILNLPQIAALARRYDCLLYVDEACSLGQIGLSGRGVEEHFGLPGAIDIRSGTLAKALAASGGYIACDGRLAAELRSRSPIAFSTALPSIQAFIAAAALDILEAEGHRLLQQLQRRAAVWRDGLRCAGFDIGESETAIATMRCPDENRMAALHQAMLEGGLFSVAIDRSWSSRLIGVRTTVTALHDEALIGSALQRLGRIRADPARRQAAVSAA